MLPQRLLISFSFISEGTSVSLCHAHFDLNFRQAYSRQHKTTKCPLELKADKTLLSLTLPAI